MDFVRLKKQPKLLLTLVAVLGIGLLSLALGVMNKGVQENANKQQMEQTTDQPVIETAKNKTHTVQDGETLSDIAQKYNIDVETLQGANANLETDIHPGDQLVILPNKGLLHTADMGDTLWSIANTYGVDVAVIAAANNKADENLSIGENLFVPGGKKPQQSEQLTARADTPVSRSGSNRFVWPTEGELTSSFGHRWGRNHDGIDLANDIGTHVRAARSGRVTYTGWYSGYGYAVVIEHEQGYSTLYGHLSDYIVQSGQYVKGGQAIAYMGNTGYSTGPHLHFEVRKNGTPINPFNVLP